VAARKTIKVKAGRSAITGKFKPVSKARQQKNTSEVETIVRRVRGKAK
jgi:hypothetical protein